MKLLFVSTILFFSISLHAQNTVDSLKKVIVTSKDDSVRYRNVKYIYDHYEEVNRDSALLYAGFGLSLARKNDKKLAEVYFLANYAYQLMGLGRYAEAMQHLFNAFRLVENKALEKEKTWILFSASFAGNNRVLMLSFVHHITGILMWQTGNNEQAILHFTEARKCAAEVGHDIRQMMANMNLGRSYLQAGWVDSALQVEKEAERLAHKTSFKKYLGQVYGLMGTIYQQKGDTLLEKQYYRMGIKAAIEQNNLSSLSAGYHLLTRRFIADGEKDSAIFYAVKNLETINRIGPFSGLSVNPGTIYENIYLAYKLANNRDSVFKYQGLTLAIKDSLNQVRMKNLTDFQNVTLQEQMRLQDVERNRARDQSRIRMYSMLAGLVVLFVIGLLLYRNNIQNRKAKLKIEKAYDDLKSTQQQLIQSEKMASLGELTAGIAHEIQNPLNFVNNFSEVNKELLAEMQEEIEKGNYNGARDIANDIIENERKINHHGQRAGAIVKSMLQHSRNSSGKKEPVNINSLCDEYLRLSYHGFRAKDKSFNVSLETNFDPSVGSINVIAQDLGRVILNLLNNAFYAVKEKQNAGAAGYEPVVSISTQKTNEFVEIRVADNGNGIQEHVADKIFQPFFTTKPSGQGTGLGLSLSYDIITKGHGGELLVETTDGKGTQFIIKLPAGES